MTRSQPHRTPPAQAAPIEVVDPRWMLKAIGLTLVAALICGYLTLCLLFYQGQWQFVLHPVRSSQPLDRLAGIPAIAIRFDAAATGIPRLSGTLVPAAEVTRLNSYIVLYLRTGDSTLAQSEQDAATISMLHELGLAVFTFDYRGFGSSDPTQPNLERMTEDTQAALRYLLSRNIPEEHVLLYGAGAGASLAVTLAHNHPALPALILDFPPPPSLALVQADPRTRALPVRSLFHENFSLAGLATLATPKLLISYPTPKHPEQPVDYSSAAPPRMTLELPATGTSLRAAALSRFLDQYLIIPSK